MLLTKLLEINRWIEYIRQFQCIDFTSGPIFFWHRSTNECQNKCHLLNDATIERAPNSTKRFIENGFILRTLFFQRVAFDLSWILYRNFSIARFEIR